SAPGLYPHGCCQGAGRTFGGYAPRVEERLHPCFDGAWPASRGAGFGHGRPREHLRAAGHGPLSARVGPGPRLSRHPGPEPDLCDRDRAHQPGGRPAVRLARSTRALLVIAPPTTLTPV